MNAAARKTLTIADLRMEMVAKIAAGAGLFVVFFSFAYSFFQIKWISDQLGVDHPILSYAFPFMIDLPSVVASALTVALHDRPFKVRLYSWAILIVFTSLSWLCNAIHAVEKSTIHNIVPGVWGIVLTVLIAGIPPVGVVLGMHLWAYALRHSSGADLRAEAPVVARPAAAAPKPVRKADLAPAPAVATRPVPARVEAPAPAEPVPATARADADAVDQDAHDPKEIVRAIFDQMVEHEEDARPDAAEVRRRAGFPLGEAPHAATVRNWVKAHWEAREAARASVTLSAREELSLAAPADADDEIDVEAHAPRHAAANVA